MTPDSMDTYRQIVDSLQVMEREIGDLKLTMGRIESAIESSSEARQIAREEHSLCRAGLEKRMDKFEEDTEQRIEAMETRQSTLITWGKAIAILGGALGAALLILNILQAIGYQV
jgi:hypothetical protein